VKPGVNLTMTKKYYAIYCYNKHSSVWPLYMNKNRTLSLRSIRRKQGGMTLLVGLILLVMLMVISVIGFRNTTLSERMTGNAVDRNVSFQSAENAGKEGIAAVEAGSLSGTGYYAMPLPNGGNTNYWTQGAGPASSTCTAEAIFSWTVCSASVVTKYANNAQKAQYVIELLSQVTSGTGPRIKVSNYRVTSRSTGGSGQADVVLQSIYSKTTITP
jgi:type IV pilus assembly protein PilX